MSTLLVTTAPMSHICPKCGTIWKSGKMSCCGRGGSWFKNCGNAGNANLDHTWYEGIWACRTRRYSAAVGKQGHAYQQTSSAFSNDTKMGIDSNAISVAAYTFVSTSANTVIPMQVATPITAPSNPTKTFPANVAIVNSMHSASAKTTPSQLLASASTIMHKCEKSFYIVTHISTILVLVSWY